jgi:hypothetical protein
MDILNQIKPSTNSVKTVKTIKTVKKLIAPTEVEDLDSGKVTKIETSFEKFKMIDLYPLCFKYIIYLKEYKKTKEISNTAVKKYSSQLENIYFENKNDLNNQLIDYLNFKYDKIAFEIEIEIETDWNKEIIVLSDHIHFENNYVIIPPSYNNIIDFVIRDLPEFEHIKLCDIQESTRSVNPTGVFNILDTNKKYCHECPFFSICDEYKNK